MNDPTYALGRSDDEHQRLTQQASFLRPLTERFFRQAGIAPGMRVLDVGSGVGDVAFLLAEIVGPEGEVVGVDMDGTALEKARLRAELLGLGNVRFVQGDIRDAELPEPFDAAAGRLVLLYFADPANALATVAGRVRAGGIVAFQEMEMNEGASASLYGDSLMGTVVTTIYRTFGAAGVHLSMARNLLNTFVDAGLPHPEMLCEAVVGGGPDYHGYSWVANTMRSLYPAALKLGISVDALQDMDTLTERLHAEANASRRLFVSPMYIGAHAVKD